jgi:DNA-binding transcriptional ArsR family regulator
MEKYKKTARQLERHLKGLANYHRIDILRLVAQKDGLSLEEISTSLNCNFKTISEHTRRLAQAGLLEKKYSGRNVLHSLSPYGKVFYIFLKSF